MKRTWTIIGVRDVAGSFTRYQRLFGQSETPPAHHHFGQILDSDGTVLLCLHKWGAHEHPSLTSPGATPPGNGLLLFFRVDDYDEALNRARSLVARFDEEPHVNPNTQTPEFSLRDPDGRLRHDQRAVIVSIAPTRRPESLHSTIQVVGGHEPRMVMSSRRLDHHRRPVERALSSRCDKLRAWPFVFCAVASR